MRKILNSLILLGMMIVSSNARANPSSSLTVTIDNLNNQSGQICVSVFSSSRGFPSSNKNAIAGQCVNASNVPVTITFDNLTAGSYAVAVIHDANNDGKLNRNFLGIPTEGVGFSRNPKILSNAPKFDESMILITGAKMTISIHLQYLFGG